MPWGIQALSAYAPQDLRWISTDRTVPMSMDELHALWYCRIGRRDSFMKATLQAGTTLSVRAKVYLNTPVVVPTSHKG